MDLSPQWKKVAPGIYQRTDVPYPESSPEEKARRLEAISKMRAKIDEILKGVKR